MGLSTKTKNNSEGWGLGLFLVFFPNDDDENNKYLDKKKMLSSSTSFKSTNTTTNFNDQLFTKAQSTISICALLVFITLLLFTLSNFDHPISSNPTRIVVPRRWLSESRFDKYLSKNKGSSSSHALQGMGTLYRRGTRAMSDLVVAHLTDDLKEDDFRIFLRTLHLSGITSRADVVVIFSSSHVSSFSSLIHQENESFLKLVQNSTQVSKFDLTQFTKERPQGGEPLWGKKFRTNYSNTEGDVPKTELNSLSYGSVVGFEVSELDPEESFSGFLDHVPIRLRRWACYPMLLGRVRRNFKHIMLVDAKEIILLGDALARVRNRGAEAVVLWKKTRSHDKKESKSVNADVIMGGMRGVRLLSNAVLNEIVRAAMQRKNKNVISDAVILSQLVNNESLLKSLSIVTSTESAVPNANSLVSMNSLPSSILMVHRENNRNIHVNYILHREICSSLLDSFVYKDCYKKNTV